MESEGTDAGFTLTAEAGQRLVLNVLTRGVQLCWLALRGLDRRRKREFIEDIIAAKVVAGNLEASATTEDTRMLFEHCGELLTEAAEQGARRSLEEAAEIFLSERDDYVRRLALPGQKG
ncbi:hypothetical protein ACFL59_15385 [Planctomycetota bacterium]